MKLTTKENPVVSIHVININKKPVRIFNSFEDPWFLAKEIVELTGYKNTPQVVAPFEDHLKAKVYAFYPKVKNSSIQSLFLSLEGVSHFFSISTKKDTESIKKKLAKQIDKLWASLPETAVESATPTFVEPEELTAAPVVTTPVSPVVLLTTNPMEVFKNSEFGEIRVVSKNGEPWFVATDLAKILGYRNASDMTRNISISDKGTRSVRTLVGGIQKHSVINESGFYMAIFGSKKDTAVGFTYWVTQEVLPSIRKYGAFMTFEKAQEALLNPDILIALANRIKEETLRRRILEQHIEENKDHIDYSKSIFNAVDAADSINNFSKELVQMGYQTGRNLLYRWLNEEKFFYRERNESGTLINVPYQRYVNSGLFVLKTVTYPQGAGKNKKEAFSVQPYITGKGKEAVYKRIRKTIGASGRVA